MNDHSRGILATCAIITLLALTIPSCFQKSRQSEETKHLGKPNVKIMSITYEGKQYQEYNGSMSEAVNFLIPIRNEGDGEAYDVQIKKKVLNLVRGTYDLSCPSLQTIFTATPFDLPERKIAVDTIFIDDTPKNMQSVSSGEKSISLEYEITYYGDKDKRNGKYLYTYKNFTTKGVFEEATAEESLNLKP